MIYKRDKHLNKFGEWDYKIFDFGVLYFMHEVNNKNGWVRLFKNWYGIQYKPKNSELLFSERQGIKKSLILFGYRFRILYPAKY